MAGYQIIRNGEMIESGKYSVQYFYSVILSRLKERVLSNELNINELKIAIDYGQA